MGKFSIITITILIFAISFYYGKSLNEGNANTTHSSKNIGNVLSRINKTLQKRNITTSRKKLTFEVKKEASTEHLERLKKNQRYTNLAQLAGITSKNNPLLNMIIGLENPKEIDHESMEEINKILGIYLKEHPDQAFDEIKNILANEGFSEDYSLRGNLMVAASFIEGKESEVKEITLREIENNIIKPDNEKLPVGKRDFSSTDSDQDKEMAVVLGYNAYLAASHSDFKNVDEDTIEIIKKQPNESVRRMLALTYDRAFPSERERMLKRLEEEGISLFPKDFIFPEAKE